jgi:hypothetical protein
MPFVEPLGERVRNGIRGCRGWDGSKEGRWVEKRRAGDEMEMLWFQTYNENQDGITIGLPECPREMLMTKAATVDVRS